MVPAAETHAGEYDIGGPQSRIFSREPGFDGDWVTADRPLAPAARGGHGGREWDE